MKKAYIRFMAMIFTSAIFMYGVMYLNTYELSHVYFSETRFYMTILSTCVMAIIMMLFMLNMLKNKNLNVFIVLVSVLIFSSTFYFMRTQKLVTDVDYMKQMIPHHSIALLTSENAQIKDPRVRKLADDIIQAQKEEIAEMKALIQSIQDGK